MVNTKHKQLKLMKKLTQAVEFLLSCVVELEQLGQLPLQPLRRQTNAGEGGDIASADFGGEKRLVIIESGGF